MYETPETVLNSTSLVYLSFIDKIPELLALFTYILAVLAVQGRLATSRMHIKELI